MMLLTLAHNWYYSIIIVITSYLYSLISNSVPVLQFISLLIGVTVGLLTAYGKILEIKKLKNNEKINKKTKR